MPEAQAAESLRATDAVAPIHRAQATVRAWMSLGLLEPSAGDALLSRLQKVLDAVILTDLLQRDFLTCAEAVSAALSVLVPPSSSSASPLGEGPDPLGLHSLSRPPSLSLSLSSATDPVPTDLLAALQAVLASWQAAQSPPLPPDVLAAAEALAHGAAPQTLLPLEQALVTLLQRVERHGGAGDDLLLLRIARTWASEVRLAGGHTPALQGVLRTLLTLQVARLVRRWILASPIPQRPGQTYQDLYAALESSCA